MGLFGTLSIGLAAIGLFFIILGALYWATGESNKSFGCATNKKLDVINNDTVKEANYTACVAKAEQSIGWAKPLCITGIIFFVVGVLGVFMTNLTASYTASASASASASADLSNSASKMADIRTRMEKLRSDNAARIVGEIMNSRRT